MSGKTNIDYHLEKLPWIEQQVFREIYKAIGYYNSYGAQFESPTDVFYGIRTNVVKIVDAMNDPRAHVRNDFLADADAVIAHLWRMADDPAVVEAVAQGIHAEVWKGDDYLIPWDKCCQDMYMADARIALTVGLTALIGPRPQGENE